MENYLIIILILILIIVYFKYTKQDFTSVEEDVEKNNQVYRLDTRYEFPTVPPVNPINYKTKLLDKIPVDKDLYSNQEYIEGYILDQNNNSMTNQLNYSGGTTQMIKIPLQMNEPYDEQLRSQEILITPYNRIKYSTTN
jgi:hypothetical protein